MVKTWFWIRRQSARLPRLGIHRMQTTFSFIRSGGLAGKSSSAMKWRRSAVGLKCTGWRRGPRTGTTVPQSRSLTLQSMRGESLSSSMAGATRTLAIPGASLPGMVWHSAAAIRTSTRSAECDGAVVWSSWCGLALQRSQSLKLSSEGVTSAQGRAKAFGLLLQNCSSTTKIAAQHHRGAVQRIRVQKGGSQALQVLAQEEVRL
mmetsp:Transcript_62734/g.149679  ORF Transcript_62734/g.149679 Transcript_62734/m.149679 type:complete len:204 (+) Transcript_62734:1576-2187(+)